MYKLLMSNFLRIQHQKSLKSVNFTPLFENIKVDVFGTRCMCVFLSKMLTPIVRLNGVCYFTGRLLQPTEAGCQ